MNAILWDGQKQLHGYLEFGGKELIFRLKDFFDTSLYLAIAYLDIVQVRNHNIFGISHNALEIISRDEKRNVFVVDNLDHVKKELRGKIKSIK